MERHWLIRASQVDFLIPLRYDQCVAGTTWNADFRRVTSRRAYEFRLVETGELVARAFTDWVFLDTHNNRPTSIPKSLVDDFFPEGAPDHFPPRKPFPTLPSPPGAVFSMHRRVSWQDIDAMHHVNNAVYLDYTSECNLQVCTAFHWPLQRMMEQGFVISLHRAQVQYLQPALLEDELKITTWISNVRRVSAQRHFTIQRARDGLFR